MIYTITLTRKKDGNSISRDYEFDNLKSAKILTIIDDMQYTIESSEDTKF